MIPSAPTTAPEPVSEAPPRRETARARLRAVPWVIAAVAVAVAAFAIGQAQTDEPPASTLLLRESWHCGATCVEDDKLRQDVADLIDERVEFDCSVIEAVGVIATLYRSDLDGNQHLWREMTLYCE